MRYLKPSFHPLLLMIFAAMIYGGWDLFWFLTDDAYISFRYASNWVNGLGLVWNPPPFLPVEGYSNFLWVILLGVIWTLFDIEPPLSSNIISLAFGMMSYAVIILFFNRAISDQLSPRHRNLLFVLGMLFIVLNRTFLSWLSSGLETSMFNFFLLVWIYQLLNYDKANSNADNFGIVALLATLMALTRPDGLLFWAATTALFILQALPKLPFYTVHNNKHSIFITLILLIVPIHLTWRYSFYDYWLPNTYYAKVVGAWPSMGLTYISSFILEYGLYLWLVTAIVWAYQQLKHHGNTFITKPYTTMAMTCVILHIAYYVIIVGGDFFEYRTLSYLIPLLAVSMVYMSSSLMKHKAGQCLLVLLFLLASLPIPLTHWAYTKDINTRQATIKLTYPISPHAPSLLKPLYERWDLLQADMISHTVGIRHQEHKIFYLYQLSINQSRDSGSKVSWDEREVLLAGAVGVPGWVMPNTAIIDIFGLNDRTVAHSPSMLKQPDAMAHARRASMAYRACFKPSAAQLIIQSDEALNTPMSLEDKLTDHFTGIITLNRQLAPTDQIIKACESRKW